MAGISDELPIEWREAMAVAPPNRIDLATIELIHPSFVDESGNATSIRCVNDLQDRTFTLEATAPLNAGQSVTFTAIPFRFTWPTQAEGQAGEIPIRIDNIGREIMPYVEAASSSQAPLTVRLRFIVVTLSTTAAPDDVIFNGVAYTLYMRSVKITADSVEGRASGADLANIQICRLSYDLETYPGLAYAA